MLTFKQKIKSLQLVLIFYNNLAQDTWIKNSLAMWQAICYKYNINATSSYDSSTTRQTLWDILYKVTDLLKQYCLAQQNYLSKNCFRWQIYIYIYACIIVCISIFSFHPTQFLIWPSHKYKRDSFKFDLINSTYK